MNELLIVRSLPGVRPEPALLSLVESLADQRQPSQHMKLYR